MIGIANNPIGHRSRRAGFTLVELLVVISIAVLIMSLAIATFANSIMTSREKATVATINKIHAILKQRKEAFDRLSFKASASSLVGTDGGSPAAFPAIPDLETAEIIARKRRYMVACPQRIEERSIFGSKDYSGYFNTTPRFNYESAALLYLFITEGETFGAPTINEDAFTTSEIKSVPTDATVTDLTTGTTTEVTIKYLVDGWGEPLRFYRWPTSLVRPLATNSSIGTTVDRQFAKRLIPTVPPAVAIGVDPLMRDPDDPKLKYAIYVQSMNSTQLQSFRQRSNLFCSEQTFHVPLIVSSGADRLLGLMEPNDSLGVNSQARPIQTGSVPTAMNDDISNYNQRLTGN